MTPNRRIALNVAATYARSAYTLALGLVTARWLFLSLGETDYGLFGLVGGLVAFVTVVNRMLATAVGRFYAVAIGLGRRKGMAKESLAECRRWFTSAICVHTAVPLVLVAIGWPVGEFAVGHWLVIPADRMAACVWVWRFSCASALVAMVNVPFRAMYTAKQEIAELTVLSMASATLNAALLFYMVTHPGDWLAKYAFWHCVLATVPPLVICVRALCVYPECRLRRDCLWKWADVRRLAAFAGWYAFSMTGAVVKNKGLMVLVNRAFGAVQNAAMVVASRLASKANVFAASMSGPFVAAIASSFGSGKRDRVQNLVSLAGKLGGLVVALVSVPLFLEVDEVMRLWLKKPPADAGFLCACVLAMFFLDRSSIGQSSAIDASGKIALEKSFSGTINVLSVPAACLMVVTGNGLRSIGWIMVASMLLVVTARVVIAERVVGLSVARWLKSTALPLAALAFFGCAFGSVPRLLMPASFPRILAVTAASEAVMLPFAWFAVLGQRERAYVREKLVKAFRRAVPPADGERPDVFTMRAMDEGTDGGGLAK